MVRENKPCRPRNKFLPVPGKCESLIPQKHRSTTRLGGEDSLQQNYIEQRFMNPNAAVVFNKAELAKSIHEEADARTGSADHFCQSFLSDLRNQRFRFPRLAKLGQQQENPRQTLLAGVEKLIDQIGLGSNAAG